jgi:Uma2 family endonuclease
MVQQATLPPLVRGVWYPMTWEEFLDWSPSEGQAEWVDGKGIAYVSNSTLHGRRVGFLGELLRVYVRVFDLGEVFFDNILLRLPTRPSGRMPDVFVVGRDHLGQIHHRWVDGPVVFAAEFVSEDDPDRDRIEKRAEYERAGIPEHLWVEARPGRRDLEFLRRGEDGRYRLVEPDVDGRYHSEALPGFWFDPAWFWQDPLPDVERLMMRIAPEAYWRYLTRLRDEETV